MLTYYLKLGVLSLKRNPVLSGLMILAIALGIGACMTSITVSYLLAADPIPHKSDRLYYVRLDGQSATNFDPEVNVDPPQLLTWIDAQYLANAGKAKRQTAMQRSGGVYEPSNQDMTPFQVTMKLAYADFFPMFDAPFEYGSGWDTSADKNGELVTVISKKFNDKVFNGQNSIGKDITVSGNTYRIVGVLKEWELIPNFFDVSNDAYGDMDDLYVPFELKPDLELPTWGNTNCWKSPEAPGMAGLLASECIQNVIWVELDTPSDAQAYLNFVDNYTTEQENFGRFLRPGNNNRVTPLMDWLDEAEVVPEDTNIMLWLSFMFLIVCLLNTAGLLMAKFSTKSGEIGLRRAIGASKTDLFIQYLMETAIIGLIGGALGILLSILGLEGVKLLLGDYINKVAHLDVTLVLIAVALSILSSLIAGIFPTWRACNIAPAAQLKSQ